MKSNKIEVFYDGDCPVCLWEIRLYNRFDKAANIIWTDIETLEDAALPNNKTRTDLLGKFHVREFAVKELENKQPEIWYIGVDAFARIWRALPGFRYFAFLFSLPVIRQVTKLAYRAFLKWQRWHRYRRQARMSGKEGL